MAKTIAALNATLSLDSRRFQQGMKRARDPMRKFREETRRSQERLRAFAAQVDRPSFLRTAVGRVVALTTAFLAFRAIKRYIAAVTDELDNLAKSARTVNIAIEDFAEFQFISGLQGVSTNDFIKGIQKMTSSIGEAATGTGEAIQAFEEMRIDLEEIIKLSPEQQFLAIANAISKVDSVNLKASFARDIFGRGGIPLLNLLNLGDEGISRFRRLAESAGVTQNLRSAAGVAEAFKDSRAILKEQTQSQARIAVTGIIAGLDAVVRSLTKDETNRLRKEAETFATTREIGGIDVGALDREQKRQEAMRKASEKAAAEEAKQTELFNKMLRELDKPLTSERDRFIDKVLSTVFDPDRQVELLSRFDRNQRIERQQERRAEIDAVLSSLTSDQESIASRLAGLTTGELGLGGSASTGQVGTLAGAQAASAARTGLANLHRVNEESKRLLMDLSRTNREIAINTRRAERLDQYRIDR